jgi:hypothetical protein
MSEKKLTPMQELIQLLNNEIETSHARGARTYKFCLSLAKEHAEQLLEKEREAIIEFAEKMRLVQDVDFDGNIKFAFDVSEQFNETFKTEE